MLTYADVCYRERAESSRLRRDGEEAEEGRRQLQHKLMHHANATGKRHVEVLTLLALLVQKYKY